MRNASKLFIAAGAIVLVSNAVALGGALANRRGAPESTLALTEREVQSGWRYSARNENSGMSISVEWRVPVDAKADSATGDSGGGINDWNGFSWTRPAWFDAAKLRELGFRIAADTNADSVRVLIDRSLRREVLFVLELNGPAYQRSLERARHVAASAEKRLLAAPGDSNAIRRAKAAATTLREEEQERSRLFVVDAGLSAPPLRERYPDRTRYAIVRGLAQPEFVLVGKRHSVGGSVRSLSIDELNVPRRLRRALEGWARTEQLRRVGPPVAVTVSIGAHLEPWISAASRPTTP